MKRVLFFSFIITSFFAFTSVVSAKGKYGDFMKAAGSFVKYDSAKMVLTIKKDDGSNADFAVTNDTVVYKRDEKAATTNGKHAKGIKINIADLKANDNLGIRYTTSNNTNTAVRIFQKNRK